MKLIKVLINWIINFFKTEKSVHQCETIEETSERPPAYKNINIPKHNNRKRTAGRKVQIICFSNTSRVVHHKLYKSVV